MRSVRQLAVKVLKTMQRQAYARYRKILQAKLAKDNSNKEQWDIVKLHMGKNGSRKAGAPSVDALAKKLSLGEEENDVVPIFQPIVRSKLRSFRVSPRRVKRVLKSLNASKSSNGIRNRFLKECHTVLVAPITKLAQQG